MPFLSWFTKSPCDVKGDTTGCLFFELKRVEYKPADCKLGSGHQEIIFYVKGLKKQMGIDPEHECEFEVRELGNGGRAEFASNEHNPSFSKGSKQVSYTLDCTGPTTLTFYVRRVDPPPAGPTEVKVKCIFRHCISGQMQWHEHVVSLLLERA